MRALLGSATSVLVFVRRKCVSAIYAYVLLLPKHNYAWAFWTILLLHVCVSYTFWCAVPTRGGYKRHIVPGSGRYWGPRGFKCSCQVFLHSSPILLAQPIASMKINSVLYLSVVAVLSAVYSDYYTNKLYKFWQRPKEARGAGIGLRTLC